jgi:hypothetical protein
MASTRIFVLFSLLALLAIHAEAARELLATQDQVIAGCRTYGECAHGACDHPEAA